VLTLCIDVDAAYCLVVDVFRALNSVTADIRTLLACKNTVSELKLTKMNVESGCYVRLSVRCIFYVDVS